MNDILVLIKNIDNQSSIIAAGFDEDEVISKSGYAYDDFLNSSVDIIENNKYGKITICNLFATDYENILADNEIESILECFTKVNIENQEGDVYVVSIHDIFDKLASSDDKTEWEEKLGLNVDLNDNNMDFDIDSMIINK